MCLSTRAGVPNIRGGCFGGPRRDLDAPSEEFGGRSNAINWDCVTFLSLEGDVGSELSSDISMISMPSMFTLVFETGFLEDWSSLDRTGVCTVLLREDGFDVGCFPDDDLCLDEEAVIHSFKSEILLRFLDCDRDVTAT